MRKKSLIEDSSDIFFARYCLRNFPNCERVVRYDLMPPTALNMERHTLWGITVLVIRSGLSTCELSHLQPVMTLMFYEYFVTPRGEKWLSIVY